MIIKNFIKDQKGSITIFVLATMMLFTTILTISYIGVSNKISSQKQQTKQVQIEYEKDSNNQALEENYNYILKNLNVVLEFEVTQSLNVSTVTITVEVKNEEIETIDSIVVTNLDKGTTLDGSVSGKIGTFETSLNGMYSITVTETTGGITKTATKIIEVNQIPVAFSTTYGKIDVIWLDTENNVIEEPNVPNLGSMTPIKWSQNSEGIFEEEETTSSDTTWYNYKAKTGTDDNLESHWANAKNPSDGSYFVWIPRYAYRITYYESETSDVITGYCDGDGIREVGRNADGTAKVKYSLDEGIETVEANGVKYIVHPAFMKDSANEYSNGGWDSDLSGIWVAKYEMSQEKSTDGTTWRYASADSTSTGNILTTNAGNTSTTQVRLVSKPNVSSWRYINIENCFSNAKAYAENTMGSHLMKNSEWGAVAYLTHSQYGRNGHEISVNQCTEYITGAGRGLNSTEDSSKTGTSNIYNSTYLSSDITDSQRYNGKIGVLSSSTGNIYGVYDLSGGSWEYVAAFNDTDTNDYETTYGSSFAGTTNSSTKYATKYSNSSTSTNSGSIIYNVGKIGDSTKEVFIGGNKVSGWFSDYSRFVYASNPFFLRGGTYGDGTYAGVFYSNSYIGDDYGFNSFRVVLAF